MAQGPDPARTGAARPGYRSAVGRDPIRAPRRTWSLRAAGQGAIEKTIVTLACVLTCPAATGTGLSATASMR